MHHTNHYKLTFVDGTVALELTDEHLLLHDRAAEERLAEHCDVLE